MKGLIKLIKYVCLAQSTVTFEVSVLWIRNLCHFTCDVTRIKMISKVLNCEAKSSHVNNFPVRKHTNAL